MRFIKRTEISPFRISNRQPAMEPSNCQISASSSGIRVTLPAFTVKVSTGQSASKGIPGIAVVSLLIFRKAYSFRLLMRLTLLVILF